MFRKAIFTILVLMLTITPALAEEVLIQYDDGSDESVRTNIHTGDVQAFRLSTAHPATLKTTYLMLESDVAADIEVHVWAEFGGNNPDLSVDLITPITQTVAAGVDWYEFDVSAAGVEIGPWSDFHVGVMHLEDGYPSVRLDSSNPSPDIRIQYYNSEDGEWYYIGGGDGCYAYMIRALVDYHDQIDEADKYFHDISDDAGLPRTNGRPAWADYDNDGDPDLLIRGSQLFENNGDGTFTEVTQSAGLTDMPGSGGIWADFDNDGYLDIYVSTSSYNAHYNRFLHNNGDGTFTDLSFEAFGGEEYLNYENTEAMAVGDFNNDGYVDVYAGVYERDMSSCPWDKFYVNNGDLTFTESADALGMHEGIFQCARGIQWIDFNRDGFTDIHVSNYRLDQNFMWVNQNGESFSEQSEELNLMGENIDNYYGHTIGSAWGDLDLDGDWDVVDANLAHPRFIDFSDKTMVLLSSGEPDFEFTNVFAESGVEYCETHSNPNLVDVDNDADLDLFITTVYVGYQSHFYLNRLVEDGALSFEPATYAAGIWVDNGWGSAWADYDGDGDMDLFATGLWRNEIADQGNWIKIKAEGWAANAAALGARISVTVGETTYLREIQGGTGTTVQDDLVAHIGVGDAETIDEIVVDFPGGSTEVLTDVAVNQVLTVTDTQEPTPIDDDDDTSDDDNTSDDDTSGADDDTFGGANDTDDADDDDDDSGCGCN
ncbi:MAG: CRTAC1 family protein [Candidatus Lernaella stagnicola]|nr:CRTAC1 family protein [Candidatus Lernaella stagnicola]